MGYPGKSNAFTCHNRSWLIMVQWTTEAPLCRKQVNSVENSFQRRFSPFSESSAFIEEV